MLLMLLRSLILSPGAQGAISRLDAALARRGETITLKRGAQSATVRALVRAKSVDKLQGTTGQMCWTIVLSPTALAGFAPRLEDDIVVKGKTCEVSMVEPVHMANELVRLNLEAAG